MSLTVENGFMFRSNHQTILTYSFTYYYYIMVGLCHRDMQDQGCWALLLTSQLVLGKSHYFVEPPFQGCSSERITLTYPFLLTPKSLGINACGFQQRDKISVCIHKDLGNNSGHASCLKHMEDYNCVYFCFYGECKLTLNLRSRKQEGIEVT